ncbi:unnamed protein product [Tilletia controversa]|uniref:Glutathione S-transferase 3, mitochondrial n=3 Tax=Tilletia TaxID=13289 RepID=A0A8X7MU14_9BASI|nr:hypothetical protein CF336_g3399 [Tilletia laevis]KAE8201918.1 hypothetical protein CF328_g2515 [Tilletia controversa]KAE8261304.1 hypothetical protein A4X03_0g3376 [Tilletia caries]KAE8204867.1 hypothetical protein CF335_g2501 [Tilletia laevis]KAE8248859.1 hypothetical protein A4X06_0g3492 [Tilletia controversa]
MALLISVPATYGYVGISAFGSILLTTWQMILVSGARKAAGIQYPQLYAEKAEVAASRKAQIFNCTQRAHANTLEALPTFLFCTLIGGLKSPRTTSLLAGVWLFSRVLYTLGYASGEPKKRVQGAYLGTPALLGLLVTAGVTLFDLVQRNNFKF